MPCSNKSGTKHHANDDRGEHHRLPNLVACREYQPDRRQSLGDRPLRSHHATKHVLNVDDRIVDKAADCNREPTERHHVSESPNAHKSSRDTARLRAAPQA